METRKLIITAPHGMHARPAAELVKLIRQFAPTQIKFNTALRAVNAASMLSILSLGLKCGSEVIITAEGGDEISAIESVTTFMENISE